jgi:predicted MFS family arabinose efflux permease
MSGYHRRFARLIAVLGICGMAVPIALYVYEAVRYPNSAALSRIPWPQLRFTWGFFVSLLGSLGIGMGGLLMTIRDQRSPAQETEPGFPRGSAWNWLAMAVFCLPMFVVAFQAGAHGILLVLIQRDLAMSSSKVSQSFLWYLVAFAVGAPIAGFLIDRVGLRLGSCVSILLLSVAEIMAAMTRNQTGLLAANALRGLAAGAALPLAAKAAAKMLPGDERILGATLWGYLYTIGTSAAAWAHDIAQAYGWRNVFYVIAAAAVLLAILAYALAGRGPNRNQRQFFVMSPALPILIALFALATILTSMLSALAASYVSDMHASLASFTTIFYPRPFCQGLGALLGVASVIGLATGGRRNRAWANPIALAAVAGLMLLAAILLFVRTVPMATLAFNLIAMGAGALSAIVLANALDVVPQRFAAFAISMFTLGSTAAWLGVEYLLGESLDRQAVALGFPINITGCALGLVVLSFVLRFVVTPRPIVQFVRR